jgi:hypothetical protein
MRIAISLAIIAGITLAGSATATAEPQITSAECRQAGLADKPAIVYRVRGGLTGTSKEWRIYLDGLVCLDGQVSARVSSQKVSDLLDEVASLGFFQLPEKYRADYDKCFQCQVYKVTLRQGAVEKTVEGTDMAKDVPVALRSIIERLNRFATGR